MKKGAEKGNGFADPRKVDPYPLPPLSGDLGVHLAMFPAMSLPAGNSHLTPINIQLYQ